MNTRFKERKVCEHIQVIIWTKHLNQFLKTLNISHILGFFIKSTCLRSLNVRAITCCTFDQGKRPNKMPNKNPVPVNNYGLLKISCSKNSLGRSDNNVLFAWHWSAIFYIWAIITVSNGMPFDIMLFHKATNEKNYNIGTEQLKEH